MADSGASDLRADFGPPRLSAAHDPAFAVKPHSALGPVLRKRLGDAVAAYDTRRNQIRPFSSQRQPERFGMADSYTWSEDKARQYAIPQRTEFGAFIRSKGFVLT